MATIAGKTKIDPSSLNIVARHDVKAQAATQTQTTTIPVSYQSTSGGLAGYREEQKAGLTKEIKSSIQRVYHDVSSGAPAPSSVPAAISPEKYVVEQRKFEKEAEKLEHEAKEINVIKSRIEKRGLPLRPESATALNRRIEAYNQRVKELKKKQEMLQAQYPLIQQKIEKQAFYPGTPESYVGEAATGAAVGGAMGIPAGPAGVAVGAGVVAGGSVLGKAIGTVAYDVYPWLKEHKLIPKTFDYTLKTSPFPGKPSGLVPSPVDLKKQALAVEKVKQKIQRAKSPSDLITFYKAPVWHESKISRLDFARVAETTGKVVGTLGLGVLASKVITHFSKPKVDVTGVAKIKQYPKEGKTISKLRVVGEARAKNVLGTIKTPYSIKAKAETMPFKEPVMKKPTFTAVTSKQAEELVKEGMKPKLTWTKGTIKTLGTKTPFVETKVYVPEKLQVIGVKRSEEDFTKYFIQQKGTVDSTVIPLTKAKPVTLDIAKIRQFSKTVLHPEKYKTQIASAFKTDNLTARISATVKGITGKTAKWKPTIIGKAKTVKPSSLNLMYQAQQQAQAFKPFVSPKVTSAIAKTAVKTLAKETAKQVVKTGVAAITLAKAAQKMKTETALSPVSMAGVKTATKIKADFLPIQKQKAIIVPRTRQEALTKHKPTQLQKPSSAAGVLPIQTPIAGTTPALSPQQAPRYRVGEVTGPKGLNLFKVPEPPVPAKPKPGFLPAPKLTPFKDFEFPQKKKKKKGKKKKTEMLIRVKSSALAKFMTGGHDILATPKMKKYYKRKYLKEDFMQFVPTREMLKLKGGKL